jgi:hypothetical protein
MSESSLTAFAQTEARLRHELGQAPLAAASLGRPLEPCNLAVCQGMCCHDGVYLEEEEAAVLAELAVREAEFFRTQGLTLPTPAIVEGNFHDRMVGPKTATVPRVWRGRVEGYPAHFPDTACCFLLPDGRCGLQVLSVERGRHRWYYKPTGCWLHPLTTDYSADAPIGLHDARSDPYRFPGYDGFLSRTFCGHTCRQGRPACETLREELGFLGAILGRDLVAEAAVPGRLSLDVVGP